MLRVAFASTDRIHGNLHFGAAERFIVYDIAPGRADLVGVGEFVRAEQIGADGRSRLAFTVEDKVAVKLTFLEGCAAVYAASIGTSSIKRLMAAGIQPIIVDNGHDIVDLLNEVSLALAQGGLAWVEKAKAKPKAANRFDTMMAEGWHDGEGTRHSLITSIDDLD